MNKDAAPRAVRTPYSSWSGVETSLSVPFGRRLFTALVVGLFGALWTVVLLRSKSYPGDLEQVWFAARALVAGRDPYQLIGPEKAFAFDFALHYPLTAAIITLPLAPLPVEAASALFIGVGLACLAWALMRHGHAPLIGLFSAGVASAVNSVQWSPLMAAATVMTPLGVLYAAKPTVGLAMFVARPSRVAVISGLLIAAAAFAVQPFWVVEWRMALTDQIGMTAFVLHPGGALALLALLRWRRPEARMLAVLACVPVTPALYETVPLLLIPRRWWEAVLLVLGSYFVLTWVQRVPLRGLSNYSAHMANSADAIALLLFPLATLIVLMRPNVAD